MMPIKRTLVVAVLVTLAAIASAQTRYRVFNSGVDFDPGRIGSRGGIVGINYRGAYLYEKGRGVTQVPGFVYNNQVYAEDVNGLGQVVGSSFQQSGKEDAFVWDRVHGLLSLGVPGAAHAYGINDLGVIVGNCWAGIEDFAFVYRPGQGWSTLPPKYGGFAGAYKINNLGQILGSTMAPGDPDHQRAVIWNPDGTITDLGNMDPQYQNFDFDINNRGWVCGGSYGPWGNVGYVWSPVTGYTPVFNPYVPLGYCAMNGLNDANVGVGNLFVSYDRWYGFYRAVDGTITRLDDLLDPVSKAQGWIITACYDIDNLGQIAAVGERNGQRYGVLLQPVPGGTLGFIPPTPAWP